MARSTNKDTSVLLDGARPRTLKKNMSLMNPKIFPTQTLRLFSILFALDHEISWVYIQNCFN